MAWLSWRVRLKQHVTYDKLWYLLIALVVLAMLLLYPALRRWNVPDERYLNIVCTSIREDAWGVSWVEGTEKRDELMEALLQRAMREAFTDYYIEFANTDAMFTYYEIGTWKTADILVISNDAFKEYMKEGAFLPLDGLETALISLQENAAVPNPAEDNRPYGVDIWYGSISGERHIFADSVSIGIPVYSKNPEGALRFINWLAKELMLEERRIQ